MKFLRSELGTLALATSCLVLSCRSTDNTSNTLKQQSAEELEVSEEDANLAIDDATGGDATVPINSGDEADFLNTEGNKDNFAVEGKVTRENMFGDEANNAELANATSPDIPVDPTATSGVDEVKDSLSQDPSAIVNSNAALNDVLPSAEGDPIAAAAAESAALTSTDSLTANDIDPVGEGSDQVPPSMIEQTSAVAETAAPIATPAPQPAAQAAPAPAADEVEPISSVLSWVGYRIAEKERALKVEIFSQGNPDYEVFEETNRAQQLELVVRFYQTSLRRKIHWDINSSEFRSPVAYVRMREYKDKGVVDVVLTHRDAILPQFYARDGRMLLVYKIPDQYFNANKTAMRSIKDRAISLVAGNEAPLRQQAKISAQGPAALGHSRGTLFHDEPTALRPIKDLLRSFREVQPDEQGLPEDFDRKPLPRERRAAYQIQSFSLSAVGQDDLNSAANDEEEEEEETSNAFRALKRSKASVATPVPAPEPVSNAAIQNVQTETEELEETVGPDSLQQTDPSANATPVPTEVAPSTPAPAPTQPEAAPAAMADPVSNISITDEALGEPAPAPPAPMEQQNAAPMNGMMAPASIEMTGQSNPNAGQPYVGKPIFMEFYDAPLSLVLKSFSEETGNNFVYSSQIGSTPVTVHFKGVPWDEALKGILETYSLGMVRIGESVVRIDQVTKLTQYMQDLEQAKLFELRRIPTKVLVFRLNNAVSKDVAARLTALLARDIEVDQRTKIQADDRTNSIVMEASTQVLAKANAIIARLDTETPQVEIASRIVEVQKTMNNIFGFAWANSFNFDPGRALGFGTLNFPNSVGSSFAVDPGIGGTNTAGIGRFRFGSLNKFIDLDLLLKMEEKKGTTNVLQSNRVLVLDGQKASILAGNSRFFRPAAGAAQIPGQAPAGGGAGGGEAVGLSEVKFNLQLDVKPQITALGSVIMDLLIKSDTPGDPTGEALAQKNTRELTTQMVRESGDTGVIGGIYDTNRTTTVTGIPFLSDIPILGALFRSTQTTENQTELLIMVTPTIVSGRGSSEEKMETSSIRGNKSSRSM